MEFKLITAYRRNKNLKDILVHTKLSTKGNNKTRKNPRFKQTNFIDNPFSQQGHPVWQKLTLNDSNVIYTIQCNTCGKLYIGETGNSLRTRMHQHWYHLRNKNKSTTLYNHFRIHNPDNLAFMGLERNPRWSLEQRRRRERFWIMTLQTREPLGLNEK